MKVLLDEDLPHAPRLAITGHDVTTARYAGYGALKNGELIAAAERDGFDVLVTGDQRMEQQQDLRERSLARVVLSAQEWRIIREHTEAIAAAVDRAEPGSYEFVECGRFVRGRE